MQLGMTPRSVQIWFQNRRQRLLKPMRNAGLHGGEMVRSGGSSDGSIGDVETAQCSPNFGPREPSHADMALMHATFAQQQQLAMLAAGVPPQATAALLAHALQQQLGATAALKQQHAGLAHCAQAAAMAAAAASASSPGAAPLTQTFASPRPSAGLSLL